MVRCQNVIMYTSIYTSCKYTYTAFSEPSIDHKPHNIKYFKRQITLCSFVNLSSNMILLIDESCFQ